jgi:hypothetical protein
MALPRLVGPYDFTITLWNSLIDALESTETTVIGVGVVSGLTLSTVSGFDLLIADGTITSRSVVSFTSIPTFSFPSNTTRYVWINEDGVVNTTTAYVPPTPNDVCLGQVTSGGSGITAITTTGRAELLCQLQKIAQAGSYVAVPVTTADVTLNRAQYGCRIIEFTGVLTGNRNVIVPNVPGYEWTIKDSTTGAFTVTVKTASGTGITLAHTKTCKLWGDGTNILRATGDV